MMERKTSLARTDDDLMTALTNWTAMLEESRTGTLPTGNTLTDAVARTVFHVELTFGDVRDRPVAADLPGSPDLPVVTYVYVGTFVAEEAVSRAGAGALERHQYELVVHAANRRTEKPESDPLYQYGVLELADLLSGVLREQGFRVTFQPEGRSRDDSEFTVGVFAERS